MNIDGTTLILFFSSPQFSEGPQKPQTLTPSKIKYEKFWPKIYIPNKKQVFFEHLIYNFKTSWPQKISIFKKDFTVKITLILMIKKRPSTISKLKK